MLFFPKIQKDGLRGVNGCLAALIPGGSCWKEDQFGEGLG